MQQCLRCCAWACCWRWWWSSFWRHTVWFLLRCKYRPKWHIILQHRVTILITHGHSWFVSSSRLMITPRRDIVGNIGIRSTWLGIILPVRFTWTRRYDAQSRRWGNNSRRRRMMTTPRRHDDGENDSAWPMLAMTTNRKYYRTMAMMITVLMVMTCHGRWR